MSYIFDKEPVAPNSLFNIDLEKQFLSSIIRNPASLADCSQVTEKSFSVTNRCVFAAIRAMQASNQEVNEYTLVARLEGLNVKIGGELEPKNYIPALVMMGVSEHAAESIGKELVSLEINREMWLVGQRISNLASKKVNEYKKDGGFMRASEVVNEATKIFNDKVNVLGGEDGEPIDLYGEIGDYVNSLGGEVDDTGAIPPFPIFHSLWGSFSPGDMSVFCARPKGSKSTLLYNISEMCVENDPDVMVLMIDTELEPQRVMRRAVSMMSGVNEFYIKTGKWRQNKEMRSKIIPALERFESTKGRIFHKFVPGKSTDEIISMCRRWHKKYVKPGNKKAIICLDYIKLGSSDMGEIGKIKDYQLVGMKVDKFKQLAAELQAHVITAAQTNRQNEGKDASTRRSDGGAIGLSDFISQYASNIYMLEKLTVDQIAEFNSLDCTHTISAVYTRNLGERGQEPDVKYVGANGKIHWIPNFVFFRIKNFKVEEITDFKTAVEKMRVRGVDVQSGQDDGAGNENKGDIEI